MVLRFRRMHAILLEVFITQRHNLWHDVSWEVLILQLRQIKDAPSVHLRRGTLDTLPPRDSTLL